MRCVHLCCRDSCVWSADGDRRRERLRGQRLADQPAGQGCEGGSGLRHTLGSLGGVGLSCVASARLLASLRLLRLLLCCVTPTLFPSLEPACAGLFTIDTPTLLASPALPFHARYLPVLGGQGAVPFMVMGADVTHPTGAAARADARDPSVAAVVATLDASLGRWGRGSGACVLTGVCISEGMVDDRDPSVASMTAEGPFSVQTYL